MVCPLPTGSLDIADSPEHKPVWEPPFCSKSARSISFDQSLASTKRGPSNELCRGMACLKVDSAFRKASLPLAVSEPEVCSEGWNLTDPVRTFARCGRNSVPRINYSRANDTHTVSGDGRPIYPSLPFSPYCSPSSSPRLSRYHQPKESKKVKFEYHPDYEQLNHYRLKGEIGQVSIVWFGIHKRCQ